MIFLKLAGFSVMVVIVSFMVTLAYRLLVVAGVPALTDHPFSTVYGNTVLVLVIFFGIMRFVLFTRGR